jgi:hypothetical protein
MQDEAVSFSSEKASLTLAPSIPEISPRAAAERN